jgi:hypothetical protein
LNAKDHDDHEENAQSEGKVLSFAGQIKSHTRKAVCEKPNPASADRQCK